MRTQRHPRLLRFPRALTLLLALMPALPALASPSDVTLAARTVVEGDSGLTRLSLPLVRRGDLGYDFAVSLRTVDDATAAQPATTGADYTASVGQLVLRSGTLRTHYDLDIVGERVVEADERFLVRLSAAVGVGRAPVLAAAQAQTMGSALRAVATGDLNGDGRLDLVTASSGDAAVAVRLGRVVPGTFGSAFAAAQLAPVADQPRAVVIADFNLDGRPDIAAAASGAGVVSLLANMTPTGAGAARLDPAGSLAVGSNPQALAVGDFNGDGRPDLAVAVPGSGRVVIAINTTLPGAATPVFQLHEVVLGVAPTAIAVADFNGDGRDDFATAADTGLILVRLNASRPGDLQNPPLVAFVGQFESDLKDGLNGIAAGDLNGDGRADLAVTAGGGRVRTLSNLTAPGASDAVFAAAQSFGSVGVSPYGVTIADLNADGKPDLAVSGLVSATVAVLRNTSVPGASALRFAAPLSFGSGSLPFGMAAADFNGDGFPELLTANGEGTVSMLFNRTAGVTGQVDFIPRLTTVPGANLARAVQADFNGDGRPDVALAESADRAHVLLNTTAAGDPEIGFGPPATLDLGGDDIGDLAVRDLDSDGRPDLVMSVRNGGGVIVRLNLTAPGASVARFAATQRFPSGGPVSLGLDVGDLNHDGLPDIAVANFVDDSGLDGRSVGFLINASVPGTGLAHFIEPQVEFTQGSGQAVDVALADLNGDGRLDVVRVSEERQFKLPHVSAALIAVQFNTTAPGSPNLVFGGYEQETVGDSRSFGDVLLRDLSGDGRRDIILRTGDRFDGSANEAAVLLVNAVPPGALPKPPENPRHFAFDPALNSSLLPGHGIYGQVGSADFDGDGRIDLVTPNFQEGTLTLLYNDTPPGASAPSLLAREPLEIVVGPGGRTSPIAVADFNADGKPDIVTASGDTVVAFGNAQTLAFLGSGLGKGVAMTIRDDDRDAVPDPIVFASATPVAPNVFVNSQEVQLGGFNQPVALRVSGGLFSVNGGAFVTGSATVVAGDRVVLRHRSATGQGAAVTTTIVVGGVSGSFTSVTGDATPDAITFAPVKDAPLNSVLTSESVTLGGFDLPVRLSVRGGSFSVDGDPFGTAVRTVEAGSTVRVRHRTSAVAGGSVTTILTVGTVSAGFTSTTTEP